MKFQVLLIFIISLALVNVTGCGNKAKPDLGNNASSRVKNGAKETSNMFAKSASLVVADDSMKLSDFSPGSHWQIGIGKNLEVPQQTLKLSTQVQDANGVVSCTYDNSQRVEIFGGQYYQSDINLEN